MKYCIIENITKEDLKLVSIDGETWRQILSSPYLVSSKNRFWYKNTIYFDISFDNFIKYVLHGGEDD